MKTKKTIGNIKRLAGAPNIGLSDTNTKWVRILSES